MTALEEISPAPAAFRVIFSDGDREIDAGEVVIDHSLTFQRFQSLIGDVIGISSHRVRLYLLRQKKARSGRPPPEIRRKTPIGEGTDFAAVARENGCAVLAQLKGTKKDRRGRGRRDRVGGGGDGFFVPEKRQPHLPEKAVPRRPVGFPVAGPAASVVPVAEETGAGLTGVFRYENLRELQRQRERQVLAAAAAAYCRYAGGGAAHGYETVGFGGGGGRCALGDAAAAVCGVCSAAARGRPAPFHWCVHDRVVAEGFRSRAGPIQRPARSGVQASA